MNRRLRIATLTDTRFPYTTLFRSQTRLSGVVVACGTIRKGAVDSVLRAHPAAGTGPAAAELRKITEEIARSGGTPLAVVRDGRLLGAVHLKEDRKSTRLNSSH